MSIASDILASQLTDRQKTRLIALSSVSSVVESQTRSWSSLISMGLVVPDSSGSIRLTDFGVRVVGVLTGSK